MGRKIIQTGSSSYRRIEKNMIDDALITREEQRILDIVGIKQRLYNYYNNLVEKSMPIFENFNELGIQYVNSEQFNENLSEREQQLFQQNHNIDLNKLNELHEIDTALYLFFSMQEEWIHNYDVIYNFVMNNMVEFEKILKTIEDKITLYKSYLNFNQAGSKKKYTKKSKKSKKVKNKNKK